MAQAAMMLKPSIHASYGSTRSAAFGAQVAFHSSPMLTRVARPAALTVEANRICDLTGKRANKANVVTFSNKKNRKWQQPNLQHKRIWWEQGQRWVSLKVCTRAIKTLDKKGLDAMAKEAGIDLWKLPYVDGRPQRAEYLAQAGKRVPVAKNDRAMKNPLKLANSTKQPRVPIYDISGKILYVRASSVEEAYQIKQQQEDAANDTGGKAELSITVVEE